LLISFVVAYLAAHTVVPAAPARHVLRVVGTAAFLGYGLGAFIGVIWKGQTWSMTLKEVFDGFIYAALTAATFAWLWPH
jgi:hypothetical protein